MNVPTIKLPLAANFTQSLPLPVSWDVKTKQRLPDESLPCILVVMSLQWFKTHLLKVMTDDDDLISPCQKSHWASCSVHHSCCRSDWFDSCPPPRFYQKSSSLSSSARDQRHWSQADRVPVRDHRRRLRRHLEELEVPGCPCVLQRQVGGRRFFVEASHSHPADWFLELRYKRWCWCVPGQGWSRLLRHFLVLHFLVWMCSNQTGQVLCKHILSCPDPI